MTRHELMEQEVLGAVARVVPAFSPAGVERFTARTGKADVYRVDSARPGGSLVLKLEHHRVCALEERVYREILVQLPVPAIRCHGTTSSLDPSRAWLVLDHAEGVPFDRRSSAHATSLARWLGVVHGAAAALAVPADLPDHGAEYWRGVVAEAHRTLHAGLENPAVARRDRAGLVSLAVVLERFLDDWSEVEKWLESVPGTLTHGDLVAQNLLMGSGTTGHLPWVHDWGGAGWGCPMIDLLQVDLAAYVESVRPHWLEIPLAMARVLRALGIICWTAWVLIEEREALSSPWPQRAAAKVPGYLRGLANHGALSVLGAGS